jgi:hypothetical protein
MRSLKGGLFLLAALAASCGRSLATTLPESHVVAHPRDWMMEDTVTIDTAGMTQQQILAAYSEPSITDADLHRLRLLDPISDARDAVARRDWQPWAVRGGVGTLLFPGFPESGRAHLVSHRFRVIRATGDFTNGPTDSNWKDVAARYAQSYNLELRRLAADIH